MAAVTVNQMIAGIPYTVRTDTSADFPSVANDKYIYNLADKLVYYKDSGGTMLSIFSSAGGSGTTDYFFGFTTPGVLTGNTLVKPLGNNITYLGNVGCLVTQNMTLKELAFSLGSSTAAASETFTVTIRKQARGIGVTGSGTQHTLGGGTLVASLGLASGGALGSAYDRNNADTGLSVALTAGDFLYAEVSNFAFWAINDLQITMRAQL